MLFWINTVLLPSVRQTGLSSHELTKMELDTRRQVLYYVEAFRRHLKGMEHCELTMIGLSIGFRKTRRIKGKSMIKAEDVLNRKNVKKVWQEADGSQRSTKILIRWQHI